MWLPDGGDPVVCPWHEGSVFVPPNQWYHMHVNSGAVENRQLRIFAPESVMNYQAPDPNRQIEYVDEEPWLRKKFEEELGKHGLTSLMPEDAYTDRSFEFTDEAMRGD
jgi:hypothetical protein